MKKSSVLKFIVLFKKIKPIHYLAIAIVIAIGIFNGVTGVMPHINQARYEKGIVKSFNKWWNEEGAERFFFIGDRRAVVLCPQPQPCAFRLRFAHTAPLLRK